MKLAILTQPLRNNYGGLLQAWALQTILMRMGHEPWIIRREYIRAQDYNLLRRLLCKFNNKIEQFRAGDNRRVILSEKQREEISRYTNMFIQQRFNNLTEKLYTNTALNKYIHSHSFDGFIVGSDQVWRPMYSPNIKNYYLNFLPENSTALRIAYAASFGVDYWEYSNNQTVTISKLASRFDLITVREKSGVDLVSQHLHAKAYNVADPTLLLDNKDYISLVDSPTTSLTYSDGNLFSYVLDANDNIRQTIAECEKVTGLKVFNCYPSRAPRSKQDLEFINECVFPPVEQWIKSFIDCQMVITDSFHGTVFSILFNRPFWVICNHTRGLTRFTSLLSTFGLEDRIITNPHLIDWSRPIDWQKVNNLRQDFASQSLEIFKLGLNKDKDDNIY